MKIDIISDTICPWCLVGKRRLEAALARRPDLDVEVTWHPFQLNPDMPAEGIDRKGYLKAKFGREPCPEDMLAALRAAGRSVDFDFKFETMSRVPNTVDSHRVIRWAQEAGLQDEIVETLFTRYFVDNQDIGDHTVLADAAATVGMDRNTVKKRLTGPDDHQVVRNEDAHVRQLGIHAVQTFIFEDKLSVQGAHEPDVFLQVFDRLGAESESESGPEVVTDA